MVSASIIIPTYNYANFISQAINSVLEQTYSQKQIEIIVVDDGSTDNTSEILQPYIDKGQIIYFSQENKGKASATNFAIKKTKGKYIFNLDADDYFLPNKILETINVFESDENIVHVASPALIYNQEKQEFKTESIPSDIMGKPVDGGCLLRYFYNKNILFGGGTTYAARSSILKSIFIPSGVDMYIDEFLILAVLPFGKSYFINETLSVWRVHGKNYSIGKLSGENKKFKSQRLLNSSAEMLTFLENQEYDIQMIKIYRLKNLTRLISYKESMNRKNIIDILTYAHLVFIVLRPNWTQIKNYRVLNRLVPTSLLRILKYFKTLSFGKSIIK